MKHTISILVENHAGVLSRISGLFSRRGFNIDSLAVGITDDPLVSRITIVVDGNDYIIEQVEKQLNKLIDVIKLRRLSNDDMVSRELVLLKLNEQELDKHTFYEIAMKRCNSRICTNTNGMIVIELCDTVQNIDSALSCIPTSSIVEVVRTGVVALDRNSQLTQ